MPENSIAIVAGDERNQQFLPLERLVIADNIIEGIQHGIALVGVARGRVSGNILRGEGGFPVNGVAMNRATDCILAENIITRHTFGFYVVGGARNTVRENSMEGGGWGISLNNEEAPTISGNRLTDLAQSGIIISGATQRCNVIENRVIRCASAANVATGVNALNILGELHVEGNEVMDLGISRLANGPKAALAYGIAGENILEARIESNLVTYSSPTKRTVLGEDRALRMRGSLDLPPSAVNLARLGFAAQITNNRFVGPGASALVELFEQQISPFLLRFDRVLFHGNYCAHFTIAGTMVGGVPGGPPGMPRATVKLVGGHCSVTGNHVWASTPGFRSYHLLDTTNTGGAKEMRGPFIGNVSRAGHSGRVANQMPNPESSFNTIA